MEIISKYYEIAKDIIEKYELYNTNLKNHRILKSIENLNKSNQNISITINEIINKDTNIKDKFNKLIDIFCADRSIYKEGANNATFEKNVVLSITTIDESMDTDHNNYQVVNTLQREKKKKKSGRH